MPHLLELFSGTGSIGRACREKGWQVTSVDIEFKFLPTICCDVLELEVDDVLEHGNVELIWASPPCTHYSCARTSARNPRDLIGSDAIVRKVLDLADSLFCYYLMENPHSGLLKTRDVVAGIPMRVLDYCSYGTLYRKRTIWTNSTFVPARPLCKKDCGFCTGGRHDESAQQGPARPGAKRHTLQELYAIPPLLAEELAEWASLNSFGA